MDATARLSGGQEVETSAMATRPEEAQASPSVGASSALAGGEEHKEEDNSSSSSSSSDGSSTDEELEDDAMGGLPSTQVLVEEKQEEDPPIARMTSPVKQSPIKKLRSSPLKTAKLPVLSSPVPAKKPQPVEEKEDATPEEFKADGPAGKFTKAFSVVAKLLETNGWQIAQGQNTLFCAMPGVQFFNFKPNINVFDSKVKACWKFVQLAGKKKEETQDAELWELLWPIAEKHFGWFTMMCGVETWFVKPNTKFEDFRPNETIFQTKKRAVLKCLAVEVGEIALGDSVEGPQVVSFAPREAKAPAVKKVKSHSFKTPSPAVKSVKRSTPASSAALKSKYVTPAKQTTSGSSIGAKRKLVSSGSKSSSKKLKVAKTSAKKTSSNKKRGSVVETPPASNSPEVFTFTPPEFKCSFGRVYQKLQEEGWNHKSGTFEYDYFSPDYTKETHELKVNYFQSVADFEEFLKVSGTWKRIEDELRDEHEQVVAELREEALEKHHRRLEQLATKKSSSLAPKRKEEAASKPKRAPAKRAPAKKAVVTKQSLYEAEVEAAKSQQLPKTPKIPMGTVIHKLVERGWFYRPGRFEYDYFKPGVSLKNAKKGEDRFESQADLEIYLKTSGIWEEIAQELADEKVARDREEELSSSQDSSASPKQLLKRSKIASPSPAATRSPSFRPKQTAKATAGVHKDEVKAITNDIWANSHEFEFDE
ncbi:hypothetical protein BBJ28_00013438 [Nothophytophthora sp. Chile5]|nr:hypothetical protein BBJ28_00013438 [Nothophytophthora sp. Chile5]